jgi:hypothetical protein
LFLHCTQVVIWQKGIAIGQSVLLAQTTQRPPGSQMGVDVPAHWAFVRHCTHDDVMVLQCGAAAGQEASLVQPVRHVKPSGSQIGALVPQSALERHWTHLPLRTRHRGEPAGQSVFARHSTHCCVAMSQIFAFAGQSLAALQPTQAPVMASQSCASWGQMTPAPHAGWH